MSNIVLALSFKEIIRDRSKNHIRDVYTCFFLCFALSTVFQRFPKL